MATQEELVKLFPQNLSLNPYVAPNEEPTAESPYTYSISQHYHHSAHIAAQQPSRPASEPPQTDQLTAEIILSRHGVDSTKLFPTQIDLFKAAEPSQQMRLIELWRICPPDFDSQALAGLGHYTQISFEQEETMAKLRYERQMLEERMSRAGGQDLHAMERAESTMSDESNTPLIPIQGGDGRWSVAAPEPYMVSGYEALAQREYGQSVQRSKDVCSHFGTDIGGPNDNQATDLIYNTPGSGAVLWRTPEQQLQAMENQYRAFQQSFYHNDGIKVAHQEEDEEML